MCCRSEHPGELLKPDCWALTPEFLIQQRVAGPRICVSSKFSHDADAACPREGGSVLNQYKVLALSAAGHFNPLGSDLGIQISFSSGVAQAAGFLISSLLLPTPPSHPCVAAFENHFTKQSQKIPNESTQS